MINEYKWAVIDVSEDQWILLYDEDTKKILIEPSQASGSYTCVNTLVVADSKEELEQYITNFNLLSFNDILY